MQGRLQGKLPHAHYFLDVVLEHATEGCNYLLAVDVDMNTVAGYAMSSWSSGYGDFVMQPDLSTLRPIPWQPGSVLVLADLRWEDGSPVVASPRQGVAPPTAPPPPPRPGALLGGGPGVPRLPGSYHPGRPAGAPDPTP